MEDKKQNFETRVFFGDKVYLTAADCAKALGYKSEERFCDQNPDIVTRIGEFENLVSEEDYNRLLVKNDKAFKKQKHIEVTKVLSFNARMVSFVNLYGLKLAIASSMYEQKAREKGCESVEEYIERYDYPDEAKRILMDLKNESFRTDNYDRSVRLLGDKRIFDPEKLDELGLVIQAFTVISYNGELELYAFLAGEGIFYQLSLYDEYNEYYLDENNNLVDTREEAHHIDVFYGDEKYAEMFVNDEGELHIPLYPDGDNSPAGKVIVPTRENRDFRDYNVFENIAWALQHSFCYKESVSSAEYSAPGIYMYFEDETLIQIFFQNDFKTLILDGIVDYDIKTRTTYISDVPFFVGADVE